MIDLPTKDENGINYVSYSSLSLFLKSKDEYYKNYILKEKFEGNEYTDFGKKVGSALELNDFSMFSEAESNTLKKVSRLDLFERKTKLIYDEFYVVGFIDTCTEDCKKIIDYKTGGNNKEFEYTKDEYTQLCYYSLSIKQELGYFPESASVEFIRRKGNLYRNEPLTVGEENPIIIPIDISYERCRKLYFYTKEIVNNISKFYLEIKKNIV